MKLDREYQKKLLNRLARTYPRQYPISDFLKDASEEDQEKYICNLYYLGEHGLVEPNIQIGADGMPSYSWPRITKDGMDFIAEDGGLSAILGVVTVRLHAETILGLVEHKIISCAQSHPDKQRWIDQLRQMPYESVKHLTMKLLDLGLENWPRALPVIQKFLD
jgi:hypothetical protein